MCSSVSAGPQTQGRDTHTYTHMQTRFFRWIRVAERNLETTGSEAGCWTEFQMPHLMKKLQLGLLPLGLKSHSNFIKSIHKCIVCCPAFSIACMRKLYCLLPSLQHHLCPGLGSQQIIGGAGNRQGRDQAWVHKLPGPKAQTERDLANS